MRSSREGSSEDAPEAIAVDLDGTLTTAGRPISVAVNGALAKAKEAGIKIVLVTGRCLAEARAVATPALFDSMVAENGAVMSMGGVEWREEPEGWKRLRAELLKCFEGGCEEVIVSVPVAKLRLAEQVVKGRAQKILNRDRLMIVPHGVDKGRGLSRALAALHLSAERTACIGDGENDLPMFDVAGLRVALWNSVDELRLKADILTGGSDGEGFMEAVEALTFGAHGRGRAKH